MSDQPGTYTFQEYEEAAARTAATANLTVRVLGLAGEAGETAELVAQHLVFAVLTLLNQGSAAKVADLLKKHLGHGHPLDKEKVKKELGDQLWYISMTARALGFTSEEVARANVATNGDASMAIKRARKQVVGTKVPVNDEGTRFTVVTDIKPRGVELLAEADF